MKENRLSGEEREEMSQKIISNGCAPLVTELLAIESEAAHAAGRRVGARAIEVLRELVELKDGPRDADYERRKPLAWQAAREVLKGVQP